MSLLYIEKKIFVLFYIIVYSFCWVQGVTVSAHCTVLSLDLFVYILT